MERQNTGAVWNEARAIINKVCPNSIIKFYCIRAKNSKGEIFVLQSFTLTMRSVGDRVSVERMENAPDLPY
jgi:hypothetical protein